MTDQHEEQDKALRPNSVADAHLMALPGWDERFEVLGFELHMTCEAFPEQYDVYRAGEQVGYLRLRHGVFYAACPGVGGQVVYQSEPVGDGCFEDHERRVELTAAMKAIDRASNALHQPPLCSEAEGVAEQRSVACSCYISPTKILPE